MCISSNIIRFVFGFCKRHLIAASQFWNTSNYVQESFYSHNLFSASSTRILNDVIRKEIILLENKKLMIM
jgi:hypothetical protein